MKSKKPVLRATHMATSFEVLFGNARHKMVCTVCGTVGMGNCDCWTKCDCGWMYEKGTACNNPECNRGGEDD